MVKLLDYAADWQALEASANPCAILVLAHLKARETSPDARIRQAWKLRLVKGLYERGLRREDVRQLFRFIDWMLDLPEALAIEFNQELERYEEEKRMPYVTSIERLALAKGKAEGKIEGKIEGKAEGKIEGKIEGLLSGIELSLDLKFGAASRACFAEIQHIGDVSLLERLLHDIKTTATLDELRRLWQ